MELYPHNLRAYNNACRILEEHNETCIIHPTGTGKAVIIGKFIEDRPQAEHLVLAPGSLMFDEISKHTVNRDFTFRTYSSINSKEDIEFLTGYQYIYTDEFHRIGAEKWGAWALEVIRNNPGAKVVGTSATHIRFLDGQRNMAAELFHNRIASHIPLTRAFAEGILIPPKYINAVYSIDEEFKSLATKIQSSDHASKKLLVKKLKKKVIEWEQTSGICAILKKHIPRNRTRLIAFCQNIPEIKSAQAILLPILQDIFPEIVCLEMHSGNSESMNRKALEAFRNYDELVKIIYTVDMANEGLHGKDISVGILMRETESPNIFFQQIGRCFSMGQQEQPIIIDLVNNFRNIQLKMFRSDYERELSELNNLSGDDQFVNSSQQINSLPANSKSLRIESTVIEFIDETQEIQNLFGSFSNTVESWEINFAKAIKFFKVHGHLYVSRKERKLHRWVHSQRAAFRERTISNEKFEKLSKIGMDWSKSLENEWILKFEKYKMLVAENGGVEPGYIRNEELRNWVKWQRLSFQNGKLDENYCKLLKPFLNMEFPRKALWRNRLEKIEDFFNKNKKFVFSESDPIYPEVRAVKAAFRNDTLPKEIKKRLTELSFPFEIKRNSKWEAGFSKVEEFVKDNGHLPFVTDNKQIYSWATHQRALFRKGKLKPEYLQPLIELGIIY